MAKDIKKVAKEALGETKGKKSPRNKHDSRGRSATSCLIKEKELQDIAN